MGGVGDTREQRGTQGGRGSERGEGIQVRRKTDTLNVGRLGKGELELSEGWEIQVGDTWKGLKGTTKMNLETQITTMAHVDNEGTSERDRCIQEG